MTAPPLRRLRDSGETLNNSDEDVRGRKVLDNAGKHIGTVDALIIDEVHHKVRFIRAECGGLLGLGTSHVMIPVEAISAISGDSVVIDRDGAHMAGAPRYDPKLIKEEHQGYWAEVADYYGFTPFRGPDS